MEPKIDLSNITILNGDTISLPSAADTITWSSNSLWSNTTITGGGYTVNNVAVNPGTYPYTIGAGAGINTSPWATTTSSKIKLDGADADIEINGISLLKTMQEIQNRLNLLQPNTTLEKEWEELYALGKKYRELEQQIKDKQATWDRLKAMPPPEID
jgi:hypothetical protein